MLNQTPHQLDLVQWLIGMPDKVIAKCFTGKYHSMEVEVEVFALFEYDKGYTSIFITSTGEYPGVDSFEIYGDKGYTIASDDEITICQLSTSLTHHINATKDVDSVPQYTTKSIKVKHKTDCQEVITQNFSNAIIGNKLIISSGYDGINVLELSNACYLSSLKNEYVQLPLNADEFYDNIVLKW